MPAPGRPVVETGNPVVDVFAGSADDGPSVEDPCPVSASGSRCARSGPHRCAHRGRRRHVRRHEDLQHRRRGTALASAAGGDLQRPLGAILSSVIRLYVIVVDVRKRHLDRRPDGRLRRRPTRHHGRGRYPQSSAIGTLIDRSYPGISKASSRPTTSPESTRLHKGRYPMNSSASVGKVSRRAPVDRPAPAARPSAVY